MGAPRSEIAAVTFLTPSAKHRQRNQPRLVSLTEGRYAATGPTLAVGGARQVQAYARRRLTRESDDTARAWWQEVIEALAR
jgi:hypothetical protein